MWKSGKGATTRAPVGANNGPMQVNISCHFFNFHEAHATVSPMIATTAIKLKAANTTQATHVTHATIISTVRCSITHLTQTYPIQSTYSTTVLHPSEMALFNHPPPPPHHHPCKHSQAGTGLSTVCPPGAPGSNPNDCLFTPDTRLVWWRYKLLLPKRRRNYFQPPWIY